MELVLRLLLAFSIPLLFLFAIRQFDFYQTGQFHLILICLGWGVIAYLLSAVINSSLVFFKFTDREDIVHIYAPVLEEFLKGLILIYLVWRPQFTYSMDGALYGFSAGIGFAIFENVSAGTITSVLQRLFSANLVHASSSALIGITVGMFWLRKTRLRWLIIFAGFFLAIGQHMFYNLISHSGFIPFIAAVGIGIFSAAFIILIMQISKMQTKNWIKDMLGMDDRITHSESKMVSRFVDANKALLPIAERFGHEKANQVEKLLYLQAHIAIKRKSLDSFQSNDAKHKLLEIELNQLQTEMDNIRRSIGIYVMLFVRGLFTTEMLSVWDRMQAKIQEGHTANGRRIGGGLWSSLEKQLNRLKETERDE